MVQILSGLVSNGFPLIWSYRDESQAVLVSSKLIWSYTDDSSNRLALILFYLEESSTGSNLVSDIPQINQN